MKVIHLAAMLSLSGCSHAETESLVGSWQPAEVVECADTLVVGSAGRYAIYNDCYGVNALDPMIVEGRWSESGGGLLLERESVRDGAHGYFADEPLLTVERSGRTLWVIDSKGERLEEFARSSEK